VKKKHNIIEINGRRYDASSGAPLDQHHDTAEGVAKHPAAAKVPVHVVEPTTHSVSHQGRHSAAQNLKSHAPQPARTLMRQAVHKPGPSSRPPKLKVSGWVDVPGDVKVVVKPSASRLDDARLHHAEHIKRSHLISRFDRRQLTVGSDFVSSFATETQIVAPVSPANIPGPAKTHKPQTTADILEMALQNATSHLEPPVKPAKRHHVWHRRHAAAH
jgi:hypothetical protein